MATRSVVSSYPSASPALSVLATWSGLLNGDDGAGVEVCRFPSACIAVSGTFGAGGSVTMEGSLDGGVSWFALKDIANAAIAVTSAGGIVLQSTSPLRIRPRCTAGDGTTSLVVRLHAACAA